MHLRSLSIISVFAFSLLAFGCGGETPANNANAAKGNSNVNNTAVNTNSPVAVTTPTPDQVTNNAPTLTPVFKAYCAAIVKKDEAGLRKIYSQDTVKYFEDEMKADGVKSLVEYLSDDQVTNELCEVSNEKIDGEKAVAKIKTKGYPNGIEVVFVKEGADWKLTNKSPEVPEKQPAAAK